MNTDSGLKLLYEVVSWASTLKVEYKTIQYHIMFLQCGDLYNIILHFWKVVKCGFGSGSFPLNFIKFKYSFYHCVDFTMC